RLPGHDEGQDPIQIAGNSVDAGFECKAHNAQVASGPANEMVGKAFRVWKVPVPKYKGLRRYALVSALGVSNNAMAVLSPAGLIHLRVDEAAFETHIAQLVAKIS